MPSFFNLRKKIRVCGRDPRDTVLRNRTHIEGNKTCRGILENVRHLVSHDGGRTFEVIRRTLEDCGYVVSSQIINASFFGAPTARKRIFIVCFRADLGVTDFWFPEPTFTQVALADVLLPDSETDRYVVRNHPIHIDREAVARADECVALRTVPVGRINDGKPVKQGYRIYSPMGHAVTFLRRGGGVGAQTGLYLINGRVRKLAAVEMSRCMGYPESFVIPSSLSYEKARRLFGNSVVVPVIRAIAERILETLRITVGSSASANASGIRWQRRPRTLPCDQSRKGVRVRH